MEVDNGRVIVAEYPVITCPCFSLRLSRDGPDPQVLLLTPGQVVMSRIRNIEKLRMLKLI